MIKAAFGNILTVLQFVFVLLYIILSINVIQFIRIMYNTTVQPVQIQQLMESTTPASFSTLHFLRGRNRLILPTNTTTDNLETDCAKLKNQYIHANAREMNVTNRINYNSALSNINLLPATTNLHFLNHHQHHPYHQKNSIPTIDYINNSTRNSVQNFNAIDLPLLELHSSGPFAPFIKRRSRSEKRPIPDTEKDDRYYEKRKRNNEAAKKSRDARKIREDRTAFRAAFLAQENSLLRAQILTLRDELQALKQLVLNARNENDTLRNIAY